jgi:hypothetical protein
MQRSVIYRHKAAIKTCRAYRDLTDQARFEKVDLIDLANRSKALAKATLPRQAFTADCREAVVNCTGGKSSRIGGKPLGAIGKDVANCVT